MHSQNMALVGSLLWVLCIHKSCAEMADDFSGLSSFFRPARTNPKTDSKEVSDIADKLMSSHRMRDLEDQQLDLDPSLFQGQDPLDLLQLGPVSYSDQFDDIFKAPSDKRSGESIFLAQLLKHLRNGQNYQKTNVGKRQQVSVSQLAQLLNSLKSTRGLEEGEGVKLQSLRFGRRRRR